MPGGLTAPVATGEGRAANRTAGRKHREGPMKHPSKDVPPTDAVFEANKATDDVATQIITDAAPPRRAPAGNVGAPVPTHTTIIGYGTPPSAARGHTEEAAPQAETRAPAGPRLGSEPVVGWVVVLDGPGRGGQRPVFNGSNTMGRGSNQRIPLDFGDQAISTEQQAFLVYDARKRVFQIVPNLGRPNLVHLNDQALLMATELKPRDRIQMGETTLLFVPLCGPDFDWSDFKGEMK
jgi:hypothetical protein